MAVETRSAHPTLLWPGVARIFGDSYQDKPEYWRSIFQEKGSSKHLEITSAQSYYGLAPEKGEGASIQYDQAREGAKYTHQNKTYALGYIVTREELEDNQYEQLSRARASELARSMRATAGPPEGCAPARWIAARCGNALTPACARSMR